MLDCNFPVTIIKSCPELQDYVTEIVDKMGPFDQIKYGSGDHEPTQYELSSLWADAEVPAASIVFWHNTDTDFISMWFNATGTSYELST